MDSGRCSGSKIILFVESLKLEDMCSIIAHINPVEKRDTSAKSSFHWQLLKCRQLIFSEPEILSSPVFKNESCIYVVMTTEFFKTGKIQLQLEKLKMNVYSTASLSNDIYESCLRYTILAHIAPQWNKVGEYLVQGRNFLENAAPMNAIKLDVGLKNSEMFLILWPSRIRLLKMEIQDLDIAPQMREQILSDMNGEISKMQMSEQMVHVLPSLKKAYVVSISRNIPRSCPFKSYKEIKRHWKNMYGYRLPENDENMVYYTLAFQPRSRTLYTYPSLCVRPTGLIFLGRVDCKDVLRAFVKDMAMKMPKICGQTFTVGNKLGCAVPKLSQSSDIYCSQNLFPASQKLIPWEGEFLTADTLSCIEDSMLSTPDVLAPLSGSVSLMTPASSSIPAVGRHFNGKKRRFPSSVTDSPPPFIPSNLPTLVQGDTGPTQLASHGTSLLKPIFSGHMKLATPPESLLNIQLAAHMTTGGSSCPVNMETMSRIVKEFQLKRDDGTMAKADEVNNNNSNKKSRVRPQVQLELDVEVLARTNDLGRANTATLVKWLREQNISCKVKDKKSDLVTKVRAHLNLPLPSSA